MLGTNRIIAKPESIPDIRFGPERKPTSVMIDKFTGGLNTEMDPTDIAKEELTKSTNVFLRNGRVTKLAGLTPITPTKPNSLAVKKMFTLKDWSGSLFQMRATNTTLHRRAANWEELTPVAIAISVAPNNVVTIDDRHFFSNGGNNFIQEILLGTDQYQALGNAAAYKYLTSFDDRLVGFGLSTDPTAVGWSGIRDYGEWDASVNPTAGTVPLVDSQSGYADFGTGVFGFADKLILLKERSIWLANRTGSPTNPFFFYVASPAFGCNVPNSVQPIPNGIVYYDRFTNNVYTFGVDGGVPTPIGTKVRDFILSSISDLDTIFSTFDSIKLEYKLAIPLAGSNITRIFVFNFEEGGWSVEERENVTSIDALNFSVSTITIGDLTGNIGDLVGNIGDLGGPDLPTPTVFYGLSDGDASNLDNDIYNEPEAIVNSKIFTSPENTDIEFYRTVFTYLVLKEGEITFAYSRDGGVTFTDYKTVPMNLADVGKRVITTCAQKVRCRQYMWQIRCTEGIFSLVEFKSNVALAGYSYR